MITSPVFHPTFCIRNSNSTDHLYNVRSPFDDLHSLLSLVACNLKVANLPEPLIVYNDEQQNFRLSVLHRYPREIKFFILRFFLMLCFFRSLLRLDTDRKHIISTAQTILSCEFNNYRLIRIFGLFSMICNSIIYKFYSRGK